MAALALAVPLGCSVPPSGTGPVPSAAPDPPDNTPPMVPASPAGGRGGVDIVGGQTHVDRPPPPQVCVAFAAAAAASDARTDPDRGAAARRAASRYGTPALQRVYAAVPADLGWARWQAHAAVAHAEAVEHTPDDVLGGGTAAAAGGGPIDRDRTAATDAAPQARAAARVGGVALGRAGWTERLVPHIVYCQLVASAATWLVDAVDVEVLDPVGTAPR